MNRKYNLSFGELVDKLSILSQKEIFIPEHREAYTKQINDIIQDLSDMFTEVDVQLGNNAGVFIRAIIILTQMNTWIWENEKNCRANKEGSNDLALTHSLNTIRTQAFSFISQFVGDRVEFKKDSAIPHKDWIPSLFDSK